MYACFVAHAWHSSSKLIICCASSAQSFKKFSSSSSTNGAFFKIGFELINFNNCSAIYINLIMCASIGPEIVALNLE